MDWLDFFAEIQGIELSGRPFDRKTGFFVTDVKGLNSGGLVSATAIARTRGPGVLYTPGRRADERAPVITGFAWGDTQIALQELHEQFSSILVEEDEYDTLSFRELGQWRWITVGRKGQWTFDRRRSGFARFEMLLRAPDQRIYGDPMESSGWGQSVTVENRGTYPAPVTIGVRGAREGYTIAGPRGAAAVVTRTLATGAQHTYDGDVGILSVGGAAQTTGVSRSDRLEVPHGRHTFSVSAGAEILVSGSDTYAP